MAYRKDYLHRDRRPPPPYTKHKPSANGQGTSSSTPATDSKLPTELFQDMCKKIANLTKVIYNLTNKSEDQDFCIKQMKLDHEKELQHIQSETKNSIDGFKSQIDKLEARLLEETRQKAQREEEFQILRRICNFADTFTSFKNSSKISSREQSPSNKETTSEDIELYNANHRSERRPLSACLSIESNNSKTTQNGFTGITFISSKHKDFESHQREIRTLVDICEGLREEKRELLSKYELELNKNNLSVNEDKFRSLESMVGSQSSAIADLKSKLEKQEIQYRKRIGELLQHLAQSENRSEKHVKQIKQLEVQLTTKENQLSSAKEELSKTVDVLRQFKETTQQQKQKLQEQTKEIEKLEKRSVNYLAQISELNSIIKDLQSQILEKGENTTSQPDDATAALDKEFAQHVEEERILHAEIQDNLEQQIDVLHCNLRQIMTNESEEIFTLRNSLEEKTLILEKVNKELRQVTSFAADLESKLRQRDEDLTKMSENLKQNQKLNLVEKLQGAMAKCLPSKELFMSSLEVKHLVNKNLKTQNSRDEKGDHEKDPLDKTEYLDKRIQALENTKFILLKEKNAIKQAHQAELDAQSEAHKKDLLKLKQSIQANFKEEKQILKKQYENQIVAIKGEKGLQRKADGEKLDEHKKNIDILQNRLQEMQNRVSRKEEDVKVKKIHAIHLADLVEELKQEKTCLVLSQDEKVHTVKHEASQQIRNLEIYWQGRLAKELKLATQTFEQEKQKLTSRYSKDQRLLKDKISSLLQSTIPSTPPKFDTAKPFLSIEFRKLHDVIAMKDSQIRKLKEERESLLTELATRRGRSSSFHSTHLLATTTEMTLGLKKPRLERPPLTPQLVRRHSLVGNSDQKWFRARSQSPLNGTFVEKTPIKSPLPKTNNHRASWTGDSVVDLLNCAIEVSSEVEKMVVLDSSSKCYNDCGKTPEPNETDILPPSASRRAIPAENTLHEDKNNTHLGHMCDTIVECDEIHVGSVCEENKHKLVNERLVHITQQLLK